MKNINGKNYERVIFKNGVISAIDEYGEEQLLFKIERVELSIEEQERMLGVYRIAQSILWNDEKDITYDDQEVVCNEEFFDMRDLIQNIANRYGISTDIIEH